MALTTGCRGLGLREVMPGWKSTIPLIGPAILLVAAVCIWQLSPTGGPDERPVADAASGEQWNAVDFSELKAGGTIPGWDVVRGTFGLVERDGRVMLEMQPEPMTEGNVTCGQLMTSGGGVRARMRGDRIRRAAPRFCVSLHGDEEFNLRAVPSTGVVEITTVQEQVLASVPWRWQQEKWLWLEFRIHPDPKTNGAVFEGRTWADGETRPAGPTVRYDSPTLPGLLRASVRGAPYALRPIYYDRMEILRTKP